MSTSTLVAALDRIKTDLDVGCTCHLTHGPLCAKRIAATTLSDHEKEPPIPERDDFGFGARMMARNSTLVPKRLLYAGQTWESLDRQLANGFEEDARAALAAVDAFGGKSP